MLTLPPLPAPRPPCGDAERRAARRLHDELRRRGMEVWVEAVWLRPQWLAGLALACLVTAAGGVSVLWAPAAGAIVTAAGAVAVLAEAAGRAGPARLPFPRRATQDVLVPPADAEQVALYVCAGYDTGRAGWVFRRPPPAPPAWPSAAAVVVAACAIARAAGAGDWIGVAQAPATLVLLATVAAAVDAGLAGWAPDRGEARAAALAIAIHDELEREPPPGLSPGLILYGAGSTGTAALRGRLRRERPAQAVVLDVRAGDSPTPGWRATTTQLREAAARAAAALELPAAPAPPRPQLGTIPAVRLTVPREGGPDTLWPTLDLGLGIADALAADVGAPRAAAPR